jgi:hypothetical protein
MNGRDRNALLDKIATKMTDDAPMECLIQCYYENALSFYGDFTDHELLDAAKEILE